jgi:hypothetical protein
MIPEPSKVGLWSLGQKRGCWCKLESALLGLWRPIEEQTIALVLRPLQTPFVHQQHKAEGAAAYPETARCNHRLSRLAFLAGVPNSGEAQKESWSTALL